MSQYEYDAAGNRTEISRLIKDEEGENYEKEEYRYDPLNQLVEVKNRNEKNRKYFYDSLGNRVRMEEWTKEGTTDAVNYQYDDLNRLIKSYEDGESPSEGKNFEYDS
ncbi:hypothetical protein GOQ27_03710 [Clostridium sp. D2Q-11]|uniref:YD repeat-containing protein n=1 Tax=Anaeromonas frigoriresistens TaxID=2683708 RepID=A0A942US29_9FIRM|nr:hypothetical protein [Anaeromonas frigoriresistens]MBS4537553.1 hypothetical protein [Anaeromonas frigoriresistens]